MEHFHAGGSKITKNEQIVKPSTQLVFVCYMWQNRVCINLSEMTKHYIFCRIVIFRCCMYILEYQIKILNALTGIEVWIYTCDLFW
jgi:hypothetical protein